jgi:hypothetical protein
MGRDGSVDEKHVWSRSDQIICRVIQGIHAIVTSTSVQQSLDRMFVVVIMLPNRKKREVCLASRLAWPAGLRRSPPPARGGALKDSVDCIASTDLYTCTSSCVCSVCKPRPGSAGGSGADRGTISCRPAFAAEPMVTPSERLASSPSSFVCFHVVVVAPPQMVPWMMRSGISAIVVLGVLARASAIESLRAGQVMQSVSQMAVVYSSSTLIE